MPALDKLLELSKVLARALPVAPPWCGHPKSHLEHWWVEVQTVVLPIELTLPGYAPHALTTK